MRKHVFYIHVYAKTKAQISCAVTMQLVSAFVFPLIPKSEISPLNLVGFPEDRFFVMWHICD